MNEWIAWSGGACPVPALDLVDVILRNGDGGRGPAGEYRWVWGGAGSIADIVSYRHIPSSTGERDPSGKDPHAPGAKMDAGKLRPWLMIEGFPRALAAVAEVTTRGAEKYTPHGWASVENGEQRYMEGFARHTLAIARGETHDNGPGGTGCLHKAQTIWNLLASLELELRAAEGWKP